MRTGLLGQAALCATAGAAPTTANTPAVTKDNAVIHLFLYDIFKHSFVSSNQRDRALTLGQSTKLSVALAAYGVAASPR